MGSIGVPEMLFIFVLALLIFGPKKLPELGKSLGKGLSEFRRASAELKGSLEREMHNLEQETKLEELSKTTSTSSEKTAAATPDPATQKATYTYEGTTHEYTD